MPPRPLLPTDDLYARLELSLDASPEAIEVAWRALLKRHHPDVAGGSPDADERSKRINVAHDWLSNPELRARYDRERAGGARGVGGAAGRPTRRGGPPPPPGRGSGRAVPPSSPPLRRRPADVEEALARHLERVERLTPDEQDRLSLAETPPVAFVASIARFLSSEQVAALDAVEKRVHERLPRAVRWNPAVRDSSVGYAQELVLGPFLDEHLSEPFRDRVRERLTRGWDAAVDQPRYGPNGHAVAAAIAGIAALPPVELRRVATAAAADPVGRSGPIWPKGLRPDEDDALRVSSELARRDIVAALPAPIPAAARRSLERATHALVLRHAFPAATFEEMLGPWRGPFGVSAAPRPSVRGEPRTSVRCDRRPRA
jgi:curved DNA-binding protein CbpA